MIYTGRSIFALKNGLDLGISSYSWQIDMPVGKHVPKVLRIKIYWKIT
jgi:hypothetical protein